MWRCTRRFIYKDAAKGWDDLFGDRCRPGLLAALSVACSLLGNQRWCFWISGPSWNNDASVGGRRLCHEA